MLGNFFKKICHQELKITQSGNTDITIQYIMEIFRHVW